MPRLEVDGVTVRYGGHVALAGVTLDVEPGVVTGLIGPNGAGKTTLFNVVCGLQTPVEGRVRLDGRDLNGLAPYRRPRLGLAHTFQRLELFGALTVRENLTVAAASHRRWGSDGEPPPAVAAALIARLGLGPVADARTDSLPTGTGRLVELGRALAIEPTVLLLDEP